MSISTVRDKIVWCVTSAQSSEEYYLLSTIVLYRHTEYRGIRFLFLEKTPELSFFPVLVGRYI